MANRRTQKSKNQKPDEDSEFDFSLSQESPPSSNTQAEQQQRKFQKALAALRKKEKAEREKKAEKERKLMQVIVKHLDHDLTKTTNIIEATMTAAEAEYSAFLTKYSIQEDKIHNLWTQIQNEQVKLMDIANERFLHQTKAIAGTASNHMTALSNLNSACNASRKVVDGLILPLESNSDSDSDWDMTDSDN